MVEVYGNNFSLFISPFLWNLGYGIGNVNITYDFSYIKVFANLTKIKKITPSIPVIGYPGIMYGQEYWFPFAGKTQMLTSLKLPMKVKYLPEFSIIVNYSVFKSLGKITDLSYDIWLTSNPNKTTLGRGDLEVMIWLYYEQDISQLKYYQKVGVLSIPTYINSTYRILNLQVWLLNYSAGGWALVILQLPEPISSGKISLPISTILKSLDSFLIGWKESVTESYYLNAIQFGMEFDGDNVNLGYYLYSFQIFITNY
jgi:hypothetical protein